MCSGLLRSDCQIRLTSVCAGQAEKNIIHRRPLGDLYATLLMKGADDCQPRIADGATCKSMQL